MFYRPSRMEIYPKNLAFNYRLLAQTVAPSRVIAVIKADGYGHGMLAVATALAGAGCHHFAVATVDEALYLRACGIGGMVLILGAVGPNETAEIVRQNLSVTITDLAIARELNRQAKLLGRRAAVHLAVDTGMGRIGFLPEEFPAALSEICTLEALTLEGVFSHFANADALCRGSMDEQYDLYRRCASLVSNLTPRPILHLANSAAALRESRYRLDAVRLGMALYGFWPSPYIQPQLPLRPTFSVKSSVAALRILPKGSAVSYGSRYITQKEEKIAVVPMGYADGLSRSFSQNIELLIGGQRCPQVGNICMDQLMVNVSHLPDVAVGDEVVVIGRQGNQLVTAEEFAGRRPGTIVYEAPILFTGRVPRVSMEVEP